MKGEDNLSTFLVYAFLFFAGCLIGWVLELFYRRFKPENTSRKWVNPGFLNGPYLPIYGFGLSVLFTLASVEQFINIDNIIVRKLVLFLLMAFAMTIIELIAGEMFIIKMKIKLWDYSSRFGNYKGIICPLFSMFWALLSAVYCFLIHPHILNALQWLSNNIAFSFVIGFFYGVFFVDLCITFRVATKIKEFASTNHMIIRYEELKSNIIEVAEKKKQKTHFLLSMASENKIHEHLREYIKIQRERQKLDKLNDFITSIKK